MTSVTKSQLGWEELPTEIKMATVSHIRDLGSLGALLHASPSAFRMFGDDAVRLAEAILKSEYTAGHVAVLFRLCALIRSGGLPITSTGDFLERVTREALTHGCRIRESKVGLAPRSLAPPDLDPSIVRGLLVVARHVSRLAGECLRVQLARFETLSPKHVCPSPHCRATAHELAGVELKQPPRGIEWEEEQRVVRAIWRVQLIYELKRAVFVTQTLPWETPYSLEATPAIALPTEAHSFYGSRGNYIMCNGRPWVEERIHRSQMPSPEYEEILAVAEFVREQHGEDAGARYRDGRLSLGQLTAGVGEASPALPVLRPARREWKTLIGVSTALKFYLGHSPIFSEYDSAADASFSPFARFGLAFWSATRIWQAAWTERVDAQSQQMCRQLWYSVLGFEPARIPLERG